MKKNNGGFSLIEVLVAIVILAAVVIPTCSALVLSHRLNAETDKLMKAQLAVSSAVETLMAEGMDAAKLKKDSNGGIVDYGFTMVDGKEVDLFLDVKFKITSVTATYYDVVVCDNEEKVSVTTTIRAKGVAGL